MGVRRAFQPGFKRRHIQLSVDTHLEGGSMFQTQPLINFLMVHSLARQIFMYQSQSGHDIAKFVGAEVIPYYSLQNMRRSPIRLVSRRKWKWELVRWSHAKPWLSSPSVGNWHGSAKAARSCDNPIRPSLSSRWSSEAQPEMMKCVVLFNHVEPASLLKILIGA